jgi:hypothetical protein
MRITRYLILLIALAACFPLAAAAQVGDGKSELSPNAALQYWQAFSFLPTLDAAGEKALAESGTIAITDPAVEKLLGSSHQSLMFLYRAAPLKQCDWGLDYNDGISMLMPHLAKSRDLARLAALDARRAFENRNWKAGRRDMASMFVLARHVGRDPVMIALLVRLGIEGMAVDTVAPYVPDIKASHSEAVAMFEAMPPAVTLVQSIQFEKKWFAGWIVPKLRAEEKRSPGAGMTLWKNLLEGPDTPASLKEIKSLDEAIKLLEEMLPTYDELARYAAMPNDQFDAQYPAYKQKVKAQFPLTALLLPSIDTLRAKEQRHQARMAMLLAGIAVAESGPEKLKDIKDPFGSGPFEYKALNSGFELKSKLQYEGQPVTLTIGQRK